jgi:hypothetical protein
LTAMVGPAAGRAGLLVDTASLPAMLWLDGAGALKARHIVAPPGGKALSAGLGDASACVVADLDGDALPDVLQPFATGALLYRGAGGGQFRPPGRLTGVGTGGGRAGAFPGDFDADGLLDVFVAGPRRCGLWHNAGKGRFTEALPLSGEVAYISKPGGIGGSTCDVNNDGRQDVLIVYADRGPQIFFNRGFRSFGHSHAMDLSEKKLLPAADAGLRAGLIADLNGDGGQDMAVALAGGELWVFFREVGDVPALCVRASLAAGGPTAGPINVVGRLEGRCLGAWPVTAGGAGAMFGLLEPARCKLTWPGPDGKERQKLVEVEDAPVRFVLPTK